MSTVLAPLPCARLCMDLALRMDSGLPELTATTQSSLAPLSSPSFPFLILEFGNHRLKHRASLHAPLGLEEI